MNVEDARNLAGMLERYSWQDAPLTLEQRQALWLTATWLDAEARAIEADPDQPADASNGEVVFSGSGGRPSDFSRGAPTEEGTAEKLQSLGKALREGLEKLGPDPFLAEPELATQPGWRWPWSRQTS